MTRSLLLVLLAVFAACTFACSSAPAPQSQPISGPTTTAKLSSPAATPAAPSREHASSTTLYVTASALNVRAEPSTSAAVVAKATRGEVLQSTGADGEWTFVRTRAGVTGWVSSQHVSTERPVAVATMSRRSMRPNGPCGEIRFLKPPVPAFADSSKHGLIVIEAHVDAEGEVMSTKVMSNSTEDRALGESTEREIRSAKFQPLGRSCSAKEFVYTYKRSF